MMFKYKNLLPDAVGRQNPIILFQMLDEHETEGYKEVPKGLEWFYGQ